MSKFELDPVEVRRQKPAVLVNNPGEELIDPLEKLCIQLDEVVRCVTRHYLTPMQKEVDLDNPKPTLVQRTRFNRLTKLNSILSDMVCLMRDLNKWRTKHSAVSEDAKKIIDKTIHHLTQITSHIRNVWISLTVALDSTSILKNNKVLERKMTEFHVHLEMLMETLIRMVLRLQKDKNVCQLNSLPIIPDSLAKVEISFPVKLSDHEKVAEEIRGKSNKK